jgi:3-methylcrotonyl-CoA carboxylase alpha subunit/geranyl-CoA carboxylase alpha subunit
MGIETVAVYTEPDQDAPFVGEATVSHPLGAPERYLDPHALVEAAKSTGADAIHPGYGFLSESSIFARLVSEAGITFIGPSADAIERSGSKTKAKALALAANVPTSPTLLFTTTETASMATEVKAFADSVGYPLLIKAAAGGGGRGMRVVTVTSDVALEIESAQREALKAFGSGEVFVERFLSPARHIEVQVVADATGAAVALGTRDCSLQRNNQKILEEAPAPHISPEVERRLCDAATRLAQGAGYSNLGTVEFLYLADGSFYFLEVNTRLQVEHPVTEAVTGLDLVELQIRIAQGESLAALGITATPPACGHAIEARWCAEEFRDGRFVNATGLVLDLEIASRSAPNESVRADMGVLPCSHISHHYDSMVGKVIAHAPSRDEAMTLLSKTLSDSHISGVSTNRSLLIHLLAHETFRSCAHTIQGSRELFPSQEVWSQLQEEAHIVAAAMRVATPVSTWAAQSPWGTAILSNNTLFPAHFESCGADDSRLRSLSYRCETGVTVKLDGKEPVIVSLAEVRTSASHLISATLSLHGSTPFRAHILRDRERWWIHLPRGTVELVVTQSSSRKGSQADGAHSTIKAHLPGKVVTLSATVGEHVFAGQVLVVLDSMKMEHPLRAPCDGTIARVCVEVGSVVQSGALMIEIAPVTS